MKPGTEKNHPNIIMDSLSIILLNMISKHQVSLPLRFLHYPCCTLITQGNYHFLRLQQEFSVASRLQGSFRHIVVFHSSVIFKQTATISNVDYNNKLTFFPSQSCQLYHFLSHMSINI